MGEPASNSPRQTEVFPLPLAKYHLTHCPYWCALPLPPTKLPYFNPCRQTATLPRPLANHHPTPPTHPHPGSKPTYALKTCACRFASVPVPLNISWYQMWPPPYSYLYQLLADGSSSHWPTIEQNHQKVTNNKNPVAPARLSAIFISVNYVITFQRHQGLQKLSSTALKVNYQPSISATVVVPPYLVRMEWKNCQME